MKIEKTIYNSIITLLGSAPIESGGIIGEKDGIICRFYLDDFTNDNFYNPNVEKLNEVIKCWSADEISFAGIVHSHPNGVAMLSRADKLYAQEIATRNPSLKKIYFPVLTKMGDNVQLHCHVYSGQWRRERVWQV